MIIFETVQHNMLFTEIFKYLIGLVQNLDSFRSASEVAKLHLDLDSQQLVMAADMRMLFCFFVWIVAGV